MNIDDGELQSLHCHDRLRNGHSPTCKETNRQGKPVQQTCPTCQTGFTTAVGQRRIYCSDECRITSRTSEDAREKRTCPVCEGPFPPELRSLPGAGDEPFPGLVEVCFTDAHNQRQSLVDKAAVFDTSDRLSPTSNYPVMIKVLCDMLGDGDSPPTAETVVISIAPWGLESVDGSIEFEVRADQLTTS